MSTRVARPHPEALESHGAVSQELLRDVPLGLVEVADLLGVKRSTADVWRVRGVLPEPDGMLSGRWPYWWPATIRDFAIATGRVPG